MDKGEIFDNGLKMTEDEAVVQLEFDKEMILFDPSTGETSTLEEVRLGNEDNYKDYLAAEAAIKALKEIRQYRAIGTVEECREACNAKFDYDDISEGWKTIRKDGFPPVGVPLIVTIKDALQGKPNELRYPVFYEKDSMKNGFCWNWRYGDFAYELLPGISEVLAWREFPAIYEED